jgi:tmRNA-binding protein
MILPAPHLRKILHCIRDNEIFLLHDYISEMFQAQPWTTPQPHRQNYRRLKLLICTEKIKGVPQWRFVDGKVTYV